MMIILFFTISIYISQNVGNIDDAFFISIIIAIIIIKKVPFLIGITKIINLD